MLLRHQTSVQFRDETRQADDRTSQDKHYYGINCDRIRFWLNCWPLSPLIHIPKDVVCTCWSMISYTEPGDR